jgi:hypothetical protein
MSIGKLSCCGAFESQSIICQSAIIIKFAWRSQIASFLAYLSGIDLATEE